MTARKASMVAVAVAALASVPTPAHAAAGAKSYVVELKAATNANAAPEVWWAARQWLHMHDLLQIKTDRRSCATAPLDRATWLALWRPYWLAKRRIPQWLPLKPSRAVLANL